MISQKQEAIKPGYYGYPSAQEGPNTGYKLVLGNNPVLRGTPLAIVSAIIVNFSSLAGFFWSNAGFSSLRYLKDLESQESRYDPTVIPTNGSSSGSRDVDLQSSIDNPKSEHRHVSAGEYQTAFKNGSLTPTTVASTILELISSTPKHQAAFVEVRPSLVLAAADASTARWKANKPLSALDGIPVTIKDEVDIEGYRKTLSSKIDFTANPNITSWCVAQWEAAGAIIIGKTNMHELGIDTTNNNADGNTPLNPHNPKYYCGGSSGGSAYAVAAGLVPISLGVDAGGSIRIPATYCGIYGLKPTHGRVSIQPTHRVCASTGVAGPLAANMADLELAYRIMATPDPSDRHSSLFTTPNSPLRSPLPPPTTPSTSNPRLLGIYEPYFNAADPPVLKACQAAISHYESIGYKTQAITLPHLAKGQLAHAMTCLTEICSATPRPFSRFSASNGIVLAVGAQTPSSDFMLSQKLRNLLMQHLAHLWREYPGMLIVTPSTANAGWFIEGGAAELKGGVSDANMALKNMTFVWLANFTACPALSVPVGRVDGRGGEGKVPVGMMAMGEWGDEEGLIQWGRDSEEWCWREGRMGKPANFVNAIEVAHQNNR